MDYASHVVGGVGPTHTVIHKKKGTAYPFIITFLSSPQSQSYEENQDCGWGDGRDVGGAGGGGGGGGGDGDAECLLLYHHQRVEFWCLNGGVDDDQRRPAL